MSQTNAVHRVAFLLAQIGDLAAAGFTGFAASRNLSPTDAGVLRMVGRSPVASQRVLAEEMGVVPSRLVVVLDSLEERGYVERRRSAADRRNSEIHLTDTGRRELDHLRRFAETQEEELLADLTRAQVELLQELLSTVANTNHLSLQVHRDSTC